MARSTDVAAAPRTRRWTGPALVLASVLAVGAHLYGLYRASGPPSPSWLPKADKLEHVAGFALPVLTLLLALRAYGRAGPRAQGLVVAVFAAHALVSELIQLRYYPHRTGDPLDVVADLVGIGLGWGAFCLPARRRGG
jgi:VanZ family protein